MSWNALSPIRRRVLVLACGLASALSGLAVATAPTAAPQESAMVTETGPAAMAVAGDAVPEVVSDAAQPASATVEAVDARTPGRELLRPSVDDVVAGEVAVPAPAARPAYRIVWMEVTAYCACTHCCGPNAQGITASGRPVSYNRGRFVAADTRLLPFYTKLSIPGYHGGEPVPVLDRGGAIKGNKLDVYFDSHETARQWGRRWLPVRVYE